MNSDFTKVKTGGQLDLQLLEDGVGPDTAPNDVGFTFDKVVAVLEGGHRPSALPLTPGWPGHRAQLLDEFPARPERLRATGGAVGVRGPLTGLPRRSPEPGLCRVDDLLWAKQDPVLGVLLPHSSQAVGNRGSGV